jgi:drug/metabolite transporter (DMT)-like permease
MVAVQDLTLPLLGAVVLAIQAVLLRMATREGSVRHVYVVTLGLNLAIIVPLALVWEYPEYGLSLRAVLAFAGAAVFATLLGRLTIFTAIQRVGASRSEPLKATTPLFSAAIAVAFLGEVMVPEHLFGIVLTVGGVAVVSWSQASGPDIPELGTTRELAFPLLAAVLFAVEPVFAKVGFAAGTPVLVGTAIKALTALVAYPAYLVGRGQLPTRSEIASGPLRLYLAAGLANCVLILVFYAALAVAPVVVVMPLLQTSPLFVLLLSFFLLQDIERVTPGLAAGVGVVVVGSAIVAVYA